jgi:hypothetical protein
MMNATQLKVVASGGVVSLTDSLFDTQLTVEEMRAAVVEAWSLDRDVRPVELLWLKLDPIGVADNAGHLRNRELLDLADWNVRTLAQRNVPGLLVELRGLR